MMSIFDGTIHHLETSLDYAMTKNNTIANNIANVDTPNYRSKDVVFKDVLNDAMTQNNDSNRTHSAHIPFENESHQPYQTVEKRGTIYNHNRNNVDIDKEMSNLAKNQLYYQSLVDRINGKFNDLKTVIGGGN